MSDVAAMRAFNREMAQVVGATITVELKNGKEYTGTLVGIDQDTLSIVLSEVIPSEGEVSRVSPRNSKSNSHLAAYAISLTRALLL